MRDRAAWLRGAFGVMVFAGAVAACEDPPPPTQEGAYFVQFTDSTISCNVANHQQLLGSVGESGKPELIKNGASNAEVICTVKQGGSGFIIEADLDGGATVKLQIDNLSDKQITEAEGARGQMQYISPETGGDLYAAPPDTECFFWVDTQFGQYLKPGEAWFSFNCPRVLSGAADCKTNGYIALKNCTGLPTEDDEEEE